MTGIVKKITTAQQFTGADRIERAMVEANRKLVEVFERKIQAKLAEIWGEEEKAKV